MIIYPTELIILGLWLVAPAVVLGLMLLYAAHVRFGRSIGLRLLRAGCLQVVFGIAVAALLVVYGPTWLARPLGVRDISILGWRTLWMPLGFVAQVLALPLALWLGRAGKGDSGQ